VQSEVQKIYEQEGVQQRYKELLNQIREELGFMAIAKN
jgi:hypothetical protein